MQLNKVLRTIIFFTLCLLLLLVQENIHIKALAVVSPWLSASPHTLTKLSDTQADYLPPTFAGGNQPCEPREVITRPKRIVPSLQTKQSHMSCVANTAYGAISATGYLQRPDSTVFGSVSYSSGASAVIVPIPYSPNGMALRGGTGFGSYVFFYDDLDSTISSSSIYDGQVTHKLPTTYTKALTDKNGNLLAAQTNSMSFSVNGDWMVVDIPFIATVRVNTRSYEVLPFGDAVNYGIGLDPSYRTAISPDGRYAVVMSSVFGIFKIYDLSTCESVPSTITTKVNCKFKDLMPQFSQNIPGFTKILNMSFNSDYTLNIYLSSEPATTTLYSHYILTASGQETTKFQYLGLGDSFASGEGAYQYKSITDTSQNKCHLSQRSYPYLISTALGFGQYESVACSGAKIQDITHLREDYDQKYAQSKGMSQPSFNQLIMEQFLPGYREQDKFIQKYSPDVITISAVGNDIGFSDKIIRCIDTDTCFDSYEDRLEIVNEINSQFYRLTDMYRQILTTNDPRSKIYVIGYPQITFPGGRCALNVPLNNNELVFAQQLIAYLNTVIKTAASNAGVMYVDVEDAFTGHRLCEKDSWNVAINGLTSGKDIVNLPLVHGPIGNESFHPNAFGHNLLKEVILSKTSGFTATMPTPKPNLTLPEISDNNPLLNAPKSNRTTRIIKQNTGLDGGLMEFGKTWAYEYSSIGMSVKANSKVKLWLNSDPVYLGEYTVGSNGSINITGQLPADVPVGWHTLHVYGKNTSDEDIDLYQTVYVSNGQDPCNLNSDDIDEDGVLDICDPLIAEAPLVVLPPIPEPTPEIIVNNPPVEPPIEVVVDDPLVLPPPQDSSPEDPLITLPPSPIQNDPESEQQDGDTPIEQPQQLSDYQNPKPPENNSETEAGPNQYSARSENYSDGVDTTAYPQPIHSYSIAYSQPQVAGDYTIRPEQFPQNPSDILPNPATLATNTSKPTQSNYLFILILFVFLPLLTLYIFHTLKKA